MLNILAVGAIYPVPRARRTVQSGGDEDPEMMRMRAKMLDRLLEMAEQLIEEAEQTR